MSGHTASVAELDLSTIDLATLAWLAGSAANEALLERIRAAGHPGVRTAHGYVIQHLIDGAPTVSGLAGALGVTQQAVSKQVAELERLGYVQRQIDPGDERVRRVTLTSRGEILVTDSRNVRAGLERELARASGQAGLDAARSVLVALLDVVGATGDVAARRARPPGDPASGGADRA